MLKNLIITLLALVIVLLSTIIWYLYDFIKLGS